MEGEEKYPTGRWRQLPSVPMEFDISIGQRTVLHRGRIYAIFGHGQGIIINCYDIATNTWEQLRTSNQEVVQQSQYHSLVVYNNRIYLYAGAHWKGTEFFADNSICYLDLHTFKWHKIDAGQAPLASYLHSAVVHSNSMFIFGGKLSHEGHLSTNKTHKFDFETEKWTEIDAKGTVPRARRAHGAAVYEDAMYIFGGWSGTETFGDLFKFDIETNTWSEIKFTHGPSPRQIDYMVEYGGKLYLYGGEGGKMHHNDFWCYDIAKEEWTELTEEGKVSALGRYANALVLDDNQLYLLGGAGVHPVDDLYVIDLPAVKKVRKSKNLFEKLQQDMARLRLGEVSGGMFDMELMSKKKDLIVKGHQAIYAVRAPKLFESMKLQGNYTVNLSKKLFIGLSEWIYEDEISNFHKITFKQLYTLLRFAEEYSMHSLIELIEYEIIQRVDPVIIKDIDFSAISKRLTNYLEVFIRIVTENLEEENNPEKDEMIKKEEESLPIFTYNNTLHRDLLKLRHLDEFSDVIVMANETPIPLHMIVVNLRFPYISGLIGFTSIKLQQSSNGSTLKFEHSPRIPLSAFNSIIDYVYSSELTFRPEDFFAIASEASYYMIDDDLFYTALIEKFRSMVSAENVELLLNMAKSYGDAFADEIEFLEQFCHVIK